jgi:hypothetical protein
MKTRRIIAILACVAAAFFVQKRAPLLSTAANEPARWKQKVDPSGGVETKKCLVI